MNPVAERVRAEALALASKKAAPTETANKKEPTNIIPKRLDGLAKFASSIERLEEMTSRSFLIDGLISTGGNIPIQMFLNAVSIS